MHVDTYVQKMVASAGGHLYKHLAGNLTEYPIPDLPLPDGNNKRLLDVGCNWGRWTLSAARKGYRAIGIDSSFKAICAARRVAQELGIKAEFVCADAGRLPFRDGAFDQTFSFSVLQHFPKQDAVRVVREMERVGHGSLIQFAGKYGIRSLYHQWKRGFQEPSGFDVRYWSRTELMELGKVQPHAFFGTGVLKSDVRHLPLKYKLIPYVSELLTKIRILDRVADSYWVS